MGTDKCLLFYFDKNVKWKRLDHLKYKQSKGIIEDVKDTEERCFFPSHTVMWNVALFNPLQERTEHIDGTNKWGVCGYWNWDPCFAGMWNYLERERRVLQKHPVHLLGSRETCQVYSYFTCSGESYSCFIFLSPGLCERVTGDISDITQMAVSRCLYFWKSEYITVINAVAV